MAALNRAKECSPWEEPFGALVQGSVCEAVDSKSSKLRKGPPWLKTMLVALYHMLKNGVYPGPPGHPAAG